MTDDAQQPDADEQPLFLDEPADAPGKTKPGGRSTEELFLDENGPNPWDSISAPRVDREPAAPPAPADTTPPRRDSEPKANDRGELRVTTATLLAAVFVAMALGLAMVIGLLD